MRKISLFICLLLISCTIYGQDKLSIAKRKDFYADLYANIYKNLDTLSDLSRTGVMFIKFNIGKHGIYDIKTSATAPPILKEIVTTSLIGLDKKIFNLKAKDNSTYVLPVEYYFPYQGNSLAPLLSKIEKLDLSAPLKAPVSDFNSMFNTLTADQNDLLGIKCVLLEPIRITGKII